MSVKEEKEKSHFHPGEQVVFMNMCMICDGDRVLALDKVGRNYRGTTFPGGHVEPGEIFAESVIREVYEETGLTIRKPVLRGVYHWYEYGAHQVVFLYRTNLFSGTLKSSEEGKVYWISRTEYEQKALAGGMQQVLRTMDDDSLTECFQDLSGGDRKYLF